MAMLLYDVLLGGKSIHDLADEIIVTDIVEKPADMDIQTADRAMHPGTRETSRRRKKLEVEIDFVIYTQDSTRRAEITSMVAAWANDGGWLTINTRPGKRLYVRPTALPAQGSALRWQEEISITFTAFAQPYWESVDETKVSAVAAWSDSHAMYYAANVIQPDGNVYTVPVTLLAWNTSDDVVLTHLKVMVWGTFFEFTDLAIEPGGMFSGLLQASYDQNDILSIRDEMTGISLLGNRTAESSDDLLARCGKDNPIHVYADTPCQVQLGARGRWI